MAANPGAPARGSPWLVAKTVSYYKPGAAEAYAGTAESASYPLHWPTGATSLYKSQTRVWLAMPHRRAGAFRVRLTVACP